MTSLDQTQDARLHLDQAHRANPVARTHQAYLLGDGSKQPRPRMEAPIEDIEAWAGTKLLVESDQ